MGRLCALHCLLPAVGVLVLAACADRPVAPWTPDPTGQRDGFGGPIGPDGSRFDGGPPLDIGPIVTLRDAPTPILGGTLTVTRDGRRAVAADPDRDALFVIDLERLSLLAEIPLEAGDEPGRSVEDDAGRVHVVLRRAGAIATVDLATLAVTVRRPVCSTPRGIAFDPGAQSLEVVCAGGEWVSLPAAGGAATRTLFVEEDLRDIVVRANDVVVSTFRSGELRVLGRDGAIVSRAMPIDPPLRARPTADGGIPMDQHEVAWRLVSFHNGSLGLLHQQASTATISTGASGYQGTACSDGIAHPAFSSFTGSLPSAQTALANLTVPLPGVLGVDFAASPDDTRIAVAFPGNVAGRADRTGVETFSLATLNAGSRCGATELIAHSIATSGQPVSVAYLPDGRLLIQNREPAALDVIGPAETDIAPVLTISLSRSSRRDSGHDLFHGNAGASIACASCHPEGGDDGHVWNFEILGARRTQSIRGGILSTAPFHWNGDMPTFDTLAHAVLGNRMGGGSFPAEYVDVLAQYVDRIPALPHATPADPAAVDRGRALFQDTTVACASCHGGPTFTSNASMDVGTGGVFQVPSLRGLRWRAPYMHDGCAATLRDRFGPCGGRESHGHTAALSPAQLDDLTAYLQTL